MKTTAPKGWLGLLPAPRLFAVWAATRILLIVALNRLGGAGDGVMPLVFSWVEEMLVGESPYHGRGVAYPPLAMFFFALTGAGEDDPAGYAERFVSVLLLVDFAGLCLARRAENQGRRKAGLTYVLAVACVGPILLFWRYDLIPAVCHVAAGLCLFLGLRRLSWAALGIGIAAKPYLLVVVPLWAVWELKTLLPSPRRRIAEGLVFAFLPSFIAAVAMLPLSGLDFMSSYTFQASRGLQVESGPAVLLAELARAGAWTENPVFSAECLCWERTGPAAGLIAWASSALAVVALALLVLLVWRREATKEVLSEKVMLASCAAVVITLVTYRVFSPQYLVWALAPLCLVAGTRAGAAGALLAGGAALAAMYSYPLHYDEVIRHTGAGRWLLLGRTAALAAAFVLLTPRKPRQAPFRT